MVAEIFVLFITTGTAAGAGIGGFGTAAATFAAIAARPAGTTFTGICTVAGISITTAGRRLTAAPCTWRLWGGVRGRSRGSSCLTMVG